MLLCLLQTYKLLLLSHLPSPVFIVVVIFLMIVGVLSNMALPLLQPEIPSPGQTGSLGERGSVNDPSTAGPKHRDSLRSP